MSKSLGNYVALNESPAEMFGKLMSIGDDLMPSYLRSAAARGRCRRGSSDGSQEVAGAAVSRRAFTPPRKQTEALEEFERRFSRRDLEHADLPHLLARRQARDFVSVVVEAYDTCFGITKSRSDARRLIEGGSVQWGGEKIVDPKVSLPTGSRGVLKTRQDPRGANPLGSTISDRGVLRGKGFGFRRGEFDYPAR